MRLVIRSLVVPCALAVALGLVAPASASQLIARNASSIKLGVNARGTAMVTYSVRGKVTHLLASGAVNARHRPGSSKIRQIHFKLDYSGGWKHRKLVWKTFKDAVRALRRPRARLVRRGLQGVERLLLGAPDLADGAA